MGNIILPFAQFLFGPFLLIIIVNFETNKVDRPISPVPIYTPEWRETMWSKVSCLRKQHDGRDWVSNHWPLDLKSNALTTTLPHPHSRLNTCAKFPQPCREPQLQVAFNAY